MNLRGPVLMANSKEVRTMGKAIFHKAKGFRDKVRPKPHLRGSTTIELQIPGPKVEVVIIRRI